jgi:hypothetical protein
MGQAVAQGWCGSFSGSKVIRGPPGMGTAESRGRAVIRIETQEDQCRCAPLPPFPKAGFRHGIAPEPGHGGARHSGATIARTRDHRNRHCPRDGAPVLPAVKLGKIIRPHQPDKAPLGITPLERAQGVHGVARAQRSFDRGGDDRRASGLLASRAEAGAQRGHAFTRFQGVAGRDQPPHLIQTQRICCEQADAAMPAVGRVEAAA